MFGEVISVIENNFTSLFLPFSVGFLDHLELCTWVVPWPCWSPLAGEELGGSGPRPGALSW